MPPKRRIPAAGSKPPTARRPQPEPEPEPEPATPPPTLRQPQRARRSPSPVPDELAELSALKLVGLLERRAIGRSGRLQEDSGTLVEWALDGDAGVRLEYEVALLDDINTELASRCAGLVPPEVPPEDAIPAARREHLEMAVRSDACAWTGMDGPVFQMMAAADDVHGMWSPVVESELQEIALSVVGAIRE